MGDRLSKDKQFKYGICLRNSLVIKKSSLNIIKKRRSKYTMFEGQLVKVFGTNRDGLMISLLNDKLKLFGQTHSNFATIEPNLLKYLNAIKDLKERTVFFKDVARRVFVLSLAKNMIVNVACPNGQRIKAMFLEVNEKERDMKTFITVELLKKPEDYLIRCFESVSDNYSSEKLQYSLPPNMIANSSFPDLDKQSEKNAIIDKTLWQCLVCYNENFNYIETCKHCSARKNDRYTFPKAGLNISANHVNNLDDKEVYPPNEVYDKDYEICFKLKGTDDNYQENKHSPENVQNNTNSSSTVIVKPSKKRPAPPITIVSGLLKNDEALKSQPFLGTGSQDEEISYNEPKNDNNAMGNAIIKTIVIQRVIPNERDSNSKTNELDRKVILPHSSPIETTINEWVCAVCYYSNKYDGNICLGCGELEAHPKQYSSRTKIDSSLAETPINTWSCVVCYHSNKYDTNICLNCGEAEALPEYNTQANVDSNLRVLSSSLNETQINPWICNVCYRSNNHNSKVCLYCGE